MARAKKQAAAKKPAAKQRDGVSSLVMQWVPLASVSLNPANPRINDDAVEHVKASIARFGFRQPLVVNRKTMTIEAGNTRWKAAKAMGLTEVPVVLVDDAEIEAAAYSIADNRSHEFAQWDEPALASILQSLNAEDALEGIGYTIDDMAELVARLGANGPKEETFDAEAAMADAEKAKNTRVKLGEVWGLGKHRVMCADATDPANWERLMAGEIAHAVCTDPPYAVGYVGGRAAQQERNLLVWVKNNGAGALFAQYKHWYEPCLYGFKRGHAPRWHGPTNERTVWEHDKPHINDLHPTMKPVALIERSISNATKAGQLVVDAFLGSGTAIIAAEQTGRRCYGFDLDARYCDVILARWESFTSQKAKRISRASKAT